MSKTRQRAIIQKIYRHIPRSGHRTRQNKSRPLSKKMISGMKCVTLLQVMPIPTHGVQTLSGCPEVNCSPRMNGSPEVYYCLELNSGWERNCGEEGNGGPEGNNGSEGNHGPEGNEGPEGKDGPKWIGCTTIL